MFGNQAAGCATKRGGVMVLSDTMEKSGVALVALRFERLLSHNANLLPKEDQEYVRKLCCASLYPTSTIPGSMPKPS